MTSENPGQTEDARLEQFDDPQPGSGARDTGEDTPEPGGGDRPVGTVDEDANPPMSDPTESETYGGTGELLRKIPVVRCHPTRAAKPATESGPAMG